MAQILLPLLDEKGVRVEGYFYDQKTQIIYFYQSIQNKKVKFSCETKNPNVFGAKRFANQKLKKILNQGKQRVTPLIRDKLPSYLKVKESEGLEERGSMANIRNALKRIEPFWGDMFPHEINRDNLAKWYVWLDETYPGQQKENPIKYMRNFCRYLAEELHNGVPLIPAVPKISDPNRKEVRSSRQRKKLHIFNDTDFKAVYDAGDDTQKLLALFMGLMATRIEETLTLRFGVEVLLDQESPIYRWAIGQNKADLEGEHSLHPSLIEPLKAARERSKAVGTVRVFPQKHDVTQPLKHQQIDWTGWRKRAGLSWHWTSHTFRHSCLSNLFNDERNPQALICKLYRVSLGVALETYIKPTESGREKMRASLKAPL